MYQSLFNGRQFLLWKGKISVVLKNVTVSSNPSCLYWWVVAPNFFIIFNDRTIWFMVHNQQTNKKCQSNNSLQLFGVSDDIEMVSMSNCFSLDIFLLSQLWRFYRSELEILEFYHSSARKKQSILPQFLAKSILLLGGFET